VIAEGRVNPGEVSGDGTSVVFGEFKPGVGESVFRWQEGAVEKLNTDGYSSFQARCNHDGSVVAFNRYSLKDATDKSGNWDIGRWKEGSVDVVAPTSDNEMSPDIDDSGSVIVYDQEVENKYQIMRWQDGATIAVSDGTAADLFAEVSGDGKRTVWRRNSSSVFLQDQNGTIKPLELAGKGPASVMLDQTGERVLYSAEDEDGDRDLFMTDLSTSQTTVIANLKGVEEYDANFSGDGKTVVYTAIDFRQKGPIDLSTLNGPPEGLSEELLAADMNVYVWRDGKTEQLTWDDGGLNTKATVSDDGNSISWFWIDNEDTTNRKVLLWQKDSAEGPQ
jgi:Tol biopolymer transport system component